MSLQSRKLERMFDTDSKIMLESLTRMLGAAEPGVRSATDIDRAFRAAHSIKSEAGFLGVNEVADSAHRLEDTLSRVRAGDGNVDDTTAAALRRGVRELEAALSKYRTSRGRSEGATDGNGADLAEPDPNRHDGRTADGTENQQQARTVAAERGALREARLRGERVFRVVVSFDTVPQMRYARAFLVVNNLEISCAVVRVEPAIEDIHRTAARQLTITVTTAGDEDVVRRAVHVDEVELHEITELSYAEVSDDTDVPSPALAAATRSEETVALLADSQEEILLLADEVTALVGAAATVRSEGTAHEPSEGLAVMLRRAAHYARTLQDRVSVNSRVQLLELLREVRLSSIRYAAAQGKRVRVVVGGHGALVSPAVGDAMLEALMHLVRNSVDHGIETIEARAAGGRQPAATIKIRVDRFGDRVRMIVQDDGTGIDEPSVRERSGDDAAPLLDILARPGFSMRDSPDRSSGRGVGLDNVVHTVRTLLNGEMRMINKPGAGVAFVVTVPATTRLFHVVIAESGGSFYAIPRATVTGRVRIERTRVKRDSLGGLYYNHDGRMLQLCAMSGRSANLRGLCDGSVGLVVRAGTEMRILLAEAVLGEEAVARERAGSRRVQSRTTGSEVAFVFPAGFAVERESGAVPAVRA